MVLGAEIDDGLRDLAADSANRGQFLPRVAVMIPRFGHRVAPGIKSAIVFGKQAGGALPDMTDTEGKQKTVERHTASGIDRLEQVLDRFRAPAGAILQVDRPAGIARLQSEDVDR